MDNPVEDLLHRVRPGNASLVIPAGAPAKVWRGGSRPARLARFLDPRIPRSPVVQPLTEQTARWVGELCAASGTRDVVDASVIVCARLLGHAVVTSDPDDLRVLDPEAELIVV